MEPSLACEGPVTVTCDAGAAVVVTPLSNQTPRQEGNLVQPRYRLALLSHSAHTHGFADRLQCPSFRWVSDTGEPPLIAKVAVPSGMLCSSQLSIDLSVRLDQAFLPQLARKGKLPAEPRTIFYFDTDGPFRPITFCMTSSI